ncbi:MAG TPA: aldehyde dehydrogenase family protein [Actinomycetota bacterium]|nr:aldehyde dehydrogenase family protein [Actinomycetota bacterium]
MASTDTQPRIDFLEEPMRLYIDGAFVETDEGLPSLNPATGAQLAEAPLASTRDVDAAVAAAGRAFDGWRFTPPTQRAKLIWRLADLLEAAKDEFATIEVLDNGKPMWEAQLVDIALTIELLRYYGGWTTKIEGKVLPNSIPGMFTVAKREPVGVVAAITPWNFPLLEVAYKLGPALAAGCTIVIKPSELAPLSTLRLMQLVDEAGFPPGVINVVIGGPEVGASLVRHPGVQKVAFTGQTATGKEIMRTAVDGLKRVTLELGGKSPNIVFADANLEAASAGAFGGIFFNQGQACVAGSRLFVEAPVADELTERVAAQAKEIRLGSGLDPETQMGPLISSNHRARVKGYVENAQEQGAKVAAGGNEASVAGLEGGFFLEPTVLGGMTNDMKAAQEEIFGPVLAVIPWETEDELLALANGVDYGLASGIWTADTSKALRIADRLDAGTVWINTYGMFDVAVPFGGRKHSGFGKELGEEALEPYLHSKSVWVDLTSAVPTGGQGISR